DPGPIDLLALALGESPSNPGVEIITDDGIKGYRFDESARLLGVNSDVIFTHCHRFPTEFSFIVTYKQHVEPKQSEFIMTLLAQDRRNVIVGIRVLRDRFYFDFRGNDAIEKTSVGFRQPTSAGWHTLIITVTSHTIKFTLDCATPTIVRPPAKFWSKINLRNTRFYVASKRAREKRFTGLLRQLVLLPGADAAIRVCPSPHPHFWHPWMTKLQVGSKFTTVFPDENYLKCFLMENFSVSHQKGEAPECTSQSKGNLFYNDDRTLEICNGVKYQPIRGGAPRMDYVIDFADIDTHSNTTSIEIFEIPNTGWFLATANMDTRGRNRSEIFRWDPIGQKFDHHQFVRSQSATRWKYFEIGPEYFLALANYGGDGVRGVSSAIYRWSRRRRLFLRHQVLAHSHARDVDVFMHNNDTILVLINHDTEGLTQWNVSSFVFKWNPQFRLFQLQQSIPTLGALGVTHFHIAYFTCIAVANGYDGIMSNVQSAVYCIIDGYFRPIQYFETNGAADWEFFVINDRFFLAVANNAEFSLKTGQSETTTTSVIYELNIRDQQFYEYQRIVTHGVNDFEYFKIGNQHFLAAANAKPAEGRHEATSVIYRWMGLEKFVVAHELPIGSCTDLDFVAHGDDYYLAAANPLGQRSKFYKIITF
uniref:Laminin G domain-containing protein n=1 Tax=Ciona savignyi TaxID=51511 RepID=H2ZI20_CIOSA